MTQSMQNSQMTKRVYGQEAADMLDLVVQETAHELGCEPDNEVILIQIDRLKTIERAAQSLINNIGGGVNLDHYGIMVASVYVRSLKAAVQEGRFES